MCKLKPQLACEALSEAQLEALQIRLQALHDSKLLSSEDLDCLEDIVHKEVAKMIEIGALSEKMQVDRSIARQLRRKFFVP
eukprot:COSAG06_NODE_5076_length_3743_cov_21.948957_1_plen_81_part_00